MRIVTTLYLISRNAVLKRKAHYLQGKREVEQIYFAVHIFRIDYHLASFHFKDVEP